MVDAAQIQYRQEFVRAFEQRQSIVRTSVTTEAVISGNQATFLVAGSGTDTAVTRGVDGKIPSRADTESQLTATLVEWHDLRTKSRFNIFASQGDQRAIMQMNTLAVLNRKIDQDIIAQLNTGTVTAGPATGSLGLVLTAKTKLGNASVPWDSNIYALITPAFEAYLLQTTEFASVDYVQNKPFDGSDFSWRDQLTMRFWLGINWCVHPALPGAGTSAEKCFLYHKSAIGHAFDTGGGLNTAIGYDSEQDYSYARASCFMGSKKLQDSGIVVITHDGSALS